MLWFLKYFRRNFWRKKWRSFILKILLVYAQTDRYTGFPEKRQFFRRKMAKMAKISYHNILDSSHPGQPHESSSVGSSNGSRVCRGTYPEWRRSTDHQGSRHILRGGSSLLSTRARHTWVRFGGQPDGSTLGTFVCRDTFRWPRRSKCRQDSRPSQDESNSLRDKRFPRSPWLSLGEVF
jgi:hypothetical protein